MAGKVKVSNMGEDWRDGRSHFSIKLIVLTRSGRSICVNRAFLALLHHHRPELVDIEDMQEGNAVENCTKAFSIAEV